MQEQIDIASWDPVWEQIFRNQEWGKYPPEHLIRFVARNFYRVNPRSRIRLMEIGCGPGANIWFMAREGFTVAGIDGSHTAIRRAIQRLASDNLSADLHVGDFAQLPWPNDSFDGIVENLSLYTNPWSGIQRALKEVCRVLKPGAPFLSTFFSDRTWGYGEGEMIDSDAFRNIPEGPLAGTGFCLFLRQEKVKDLFHDFADIDTERITRAFDRQQHIVEHLVITCRKPLR
jgi:SAM-dependent methyltransferase